MTLYKNKYRIETTRVRGWDYRNAGFYFVTLFTQDRRSTFGDIHAGLVHLSTLGEIAHQYWVEIPAHHQGIALDEFVIMPNHVHGILCINHTAVETLHATSLPPHDISKRNPAMSNISPRSGSIGAIIRSYKSAVTNWARRHGHRDFVWQTRYFEHIIRNEESFQRIRQYILENPLNWESDQENPANRSSL